MPWERVAWVALTDISGMGKNNKKQYEKGPTSQFLFKERKIRSHNNWPPPLDFRGEREPESLFEALVILAKPSLLSVALAGD